MAFASNPPLKAGQEFDAGTNVAGPMNQRGRWGVKREAKRIIVFFHYFFPKSEAMIKAFDIDEEGAARAYARQCCEKKILPDRKQKG
jgi:hypothetical protein